MSPHHRIGHGGISNPEVSDLMLTQDWKMFGSQRVLQCVCAYDVCFG